MKLLALLLLACVIGSSLYLVKTAYDARRLYTLLDRAKAEHGKLETEFKRLDAERQAQATNLRVEKTAREKLAMRNPTPAVTLFVPDTITPAAASAAAAGASR